LNFVPNERSQAAIQRTARKAWSGEKARGRAAGGSDKVTGITARRARSLTIQRTVICLADAGSLGLYNPPSNIQ
jgi:hypothetical protein